MSDRIKPLHTKPGVRIGLSVVSGFMTYLLATTNVPDHLHELFDRSVPAGITDGAVGFHLPIAIMQLIAIGIVLVIFGMMIYRKARHREPLPVAFVGVGTVIILASVAASSLYNAIYVIIVTDWDYGPIDMRQSFGVATCFTIFAIIAAVFARNPDG